jgi:hypothetical protein
MSIAWGTIEKALHKMVVNGSGLSADKVVWSQQPGPRPTGTHIAMRVAVIKRIGHDWLQVEDAAIPSQGAEINLLSRGMRECRFQLQCFSDTGVGSGAAAMVLDSVVSRSNFQTAADALNTAGIGLCPWEQVVSIDGILGSSTFEPRATVETRFFLASEVLETATFIETVQMENEDTGDTFEVP